jgi:hypothetical protein
MLPLFASFITVRASFAKSKERCKESSCELSLEGSKTDERSTSDARRRARSLNVTERGRLLDFMSRVVGEQPFLSLAITMVAVYRTRTLLLVGARYLFDLVPGTYSTDSNSTLWTKADVYRLDIAFSSTSLSFAHLPAVGLLFDFSRALWQLWVILSSRIPFRSIRDHSLQGKVIHMLS